MKKYLLPLLLFIHLAVSAQIPGMDPEKQKNMRRLEGEEAAAIYAQLFQQEKESAELHIKLGDAYFDQSKPVQAKKHYQRAVALDNASSKAKEGLERAIKKLESKDAALKKFQKLEQEEKKPQHVCSQAAILFHMGYMGEAIEFLHNAESEYQDTRDIKGLEYTFRQGVALEMSVLQNVVNDYKQSLATKDLSGALKHVGEYVFFSLGTGNLELMSKDFMDTFPGNAAGKAILAAGKLLKE